MNPYQVYYAGAPLSKASKALILLHGRGSSTQNILPLADHFCDEHFCIAVPQAPQGSWYPNSFMAEEKLNEPFLSASIENIENLIQHLQKFIPLKHIFIMGFSQGACLTLEVSARFANKYGGVAAFTGGLIGKTVNERNYKGNFEGTKIFIGNSDKDPHVPLERSEQTKVLLQKLGGEVTLKVYPGMAHTINDQEISWVKNNIFSI